MAVLLFIFSSFQERIEKDFEESDSLYVEYITELLLTYRLKVVSQKFETTSLKTRDESKVYYYSGFFISLIAFNYSFGWLKNNCFTY